MSKFRNMQLEKLIEFVFYLEIDHEQISNQKSSKNKETPPKTPLSLYFCFLKTQNNKKVFDY